MNREDHNNRRMIMSKIAKHLGRPLPPNYAFKTELGLHRKFTWKERWAIFLGCPITIDIQIAHLHNPGASASKVVVKTTTEIDPERVESL